MFRTYNVGGVADRMWIGAGGNVGLGTNSPVSKLLVYNGASGNTMTSTYSQLDIENNVDAGVGTTTPSTKLEVYSNSSGGLRVYGPVSNVGGMIQVRDNDDAAATPWPGGAHIAIWPNNAGLEILRFVKSGISQWDFVDRSTVNSAAGRKLAIHDANGVGDIMTFWGNGYVGVGTSTPGYKLDIEGGDLYVSNSSGGYFRTGAETDLPYSGGADGYFIFQNMTAGKTTAFYRAGAWAPISASSFVVSSARRFKRDIRDLQYGLKDVLKLQPKEYKYLRDSTRNEVGFIAEEVLPIIPEVVYFNDISHEVLGIDYGKFASILVKSIQEQQKMIDELKNENAQLKASYESQKSGTETLNNKLENLESIVKTLQLQISTAATLDKKK